MTKILYTINFLTNGGPTRVLQNIIKNLKKETYEIYILTLIDENDKNIVNELKEQGICLIEFKYEKSLVKILKEKEKIINKINSLNPDIIHTHGIVSTLLVANKNVKGNKVTTIHNNIFEDYKYTYGPLKGPLYSLVHIFLLKRYDMTICCSKTSYNLLKNKVKNISFIQNGVDIDINTNRANIRKKIRKDLNFNDNDIVYTYVGVVNERKRVAELVKMFSTYHEEYEHLLIVGDGPLLEKAKKYKDSNIYFLGFRANAVDYLCASDIYISNSSSEGFSISIIEALGTGLMCLLSDIPSHKECFEISKKTYIGEYFNKKNFKEKKKILSSQVKKVSKKEIIKFQNKNLSSSAMANKYLNVYIKVGEK